MTSIICQLKVMLMSLALYYAALCVISWWWWWSDHKQTYAWYCCDCYSAASREKAYFSCPSSRNEGVKAVLRTIPVF